MKRTKALICGKFNPPHLGHALTIMKILRAYEDVTICVTADVPADAVYTPEEIAEEMQGFGVPVKLFLGTLTEQELDPFPGYTYLTGNQKVMEWAENVGAEAHFVPRTGNISGTKIRENGNS